MPSYDSVAKLVARQVLGGVQDDLVAAAKEAMDLGLTELQQKHQLIKQEKAHEFTSTGAGLYTFRAAPIGKSDVFRVRKMWTRDRPLKTPHYAEFIELNPSFLDFASGIPSHAIMWEDDTIRIWPDSSGTVIYMIYYSIIDENQADHVLWVLKDIATRMLDPAPETRMANYQIAALSAKEAGRANSRSIDQPMRFLPEEQVSALNIWKRRRRHK